MYWSISIIIITAMMGVLAVVDTTSLPINALLLTQVNASIWALLLIFIAATLLYIKPLSFLSSPLSNPPLNPRLKPAVISKQLFVILRYLFVISLSLLLIIGSALQALIHYQQAETTKVAESMRVQAWVTIEGISDSVYDPLNDSGYRQVATLRAVSPLVSEISAEALNSDTINRSSTEGDNSLSNINNPNYSSQNKRQYPAYRVLLNAYPKNSSKDSKDSQASVINNLQPGDQLWMTLSLAPLKSSQQALDNPQGFDSYRWLRSRHIDGMATIIAMGSPIDASINASGVPNAVGTTLLSTKKSLVKRLRTIIDQGRWQLRQHFYVDWNAQTSAERQAKAVTLSLLTGDRSLISRETKDLYQRAGISHLLAISGTHVLFLAIVLAGLVISLLNRFYSGVYRRIPRWQLRWLVMISAAFIYALFTGFDVPAARTAWMLLVIGLMRMTLLPISTMRILLTLAVVMAWFDPYVLWQAGYWLSFIAVALLLRYEEGRPDQTSVVPLANMNTQLRTHLRPSAAKKSKASVLYTQLWLLLKRIFKLQFWLFIALLPITLLLFGKVSLWGLVINLFAIGLFGWIIVPLNLVAGLCYLFSPALADIIWALVSAIIGCLHTFIDKLTSLPALSAAWLYTPVNMGVLLIALLIILPWLLPRGLISRWLALPPLALLMMSVYGNQQALSLTPTLYILPTGDQKLTAVLLQYPTNITDQPNYKKPEKNNDTDNISWLFLADHRPQEQLSKPSSLSADKLSTTLEQQLRTLAVKSLEGIIVQTSAELLMINDEVNKQKSAHITSRSKAKNSQPLSILPKVVALLSRKLPTSEYWQAGRQIAPSLDMPITAQNCGQAKIWQSANGSLVLKAMTGWSEIKDSRVWDCVIAIDSALPITVKRYDAANPYKSKPVDGQKLIGQAFNQNQQSQSQQNLSSAQQKTLQSQKMQSRLILDAATHQRVWQLWSLLCQTQPYAINMTSESAAIDSITWLSHSQASTSAKILTTQRVKEVLTYDNKALEASFSSMLVSSEP